MGEERRNLTGVKRNVPPIVIVRMEVFLIRAKHHELENLLDRLISSCHE